MMFRGLADTLSKNVNKIETIITGRKFAQGMCAAAAAGVITGILITHKSRKKMREEIKNQASSAAVIIEVRDLKRLLIERIE